MLSNVPGVPHAVYLGDARLGGLYPVSTMGAGIGLNVTLASYAGSMDFGFVANSMALPRLGSLVAHCAAAYEELKAAAEVRGGAPLSAPLSARLSAPMPAAPSRKPPAAKKAGRASGTAAAAARQAPRKRAARPKTAARKTAKAA